MKISSKTHGVLDYIVGLLLIAAPWLLNFARGGAETWVPVVLGVTTIIYSLLTDYEMGAAKVISYRTHLTVDMLSGILLAASPWLFNFDEYVYMPHLVVGILEIIVVAVSESRAWQHSTNTSAGRTQAPAH